MTVSFIRVFTVFFSSLFCYLFKLKGNKPLYLAGENLLKRSFRLPNRASKDRLIVPKEALKAIVRLFNNSDYSRACSVNSNEIIYDNNIQSIPLREKYIEYYAKEKVNSYILKNELQNVGLDLTSACFASLFLLFASLVMFPISFFSSKRASFALLFTEIIETVNFLGIVKEKKVEKVYFFSIYEKDSNLLTYLLMQSGIYIIKIPSEVPFYFYNRIIIADKLIICNAYQFDELKEYNNSIIYKETEFWGPETVCESNEIYAKPFVQENGRIGFYSTGAWIRNLEGHMDQGVNMEANENKLLNYLKDFVTINSQYTLVVYCHPREKSEKYIDQTKNRYTSLLGNTFEFADFTLKSAQTFNLVDVAVLFSSTLAYERLYFGFKTILYPVEHPGFPIKWSAFNSICCFSKEELFDLLLKSLKQDTNAFFEKNKIEQYRFFKH